ncbi:hypothetical protein [Rhizobium sp. Rhizsp42]|uniref:hypothetical protein n=1 Tax=Rhizobium sp. Rhizsp42 TaxID=3243034 RepID=UPI0039AF772E
MTQRSIGFQFRYKTADPARSHDIAYAYDGPELISQVPIDRVRVFDFSHYDGSPDDYHSPERRFDSLLAGLPSPTSRVRLDDLEVVQINHAGQTAWHGQTDYTEVYFTCVLPFICTGFLDLKDLKVSASIAASRQAVPDFWTLEKRLRSLLGEWEIR